MNPAAWVFLATSLILAALFLVVLLGGAAQRGDLIHERAEQDRAYLRLGARLLRSEQTVADQREEIDLLRGHLIRALGGRPVQAVSTVAAEAEAFLRDRGDGA